MIYPCVCRTWVRQLVSLLLFLCRFLSLIDLRISGYILRTGNTIADNWFYFMRTFLPYTQQIFNLCDRVVFYCFFMRSRWVVLWSAFVFLLIIRFLLSVFYPAMAISIAIPRIVNVRLNRNIIVFWHIAEPNIDPIINIVITVVMI